jgi:AraC-like DNA-binding protein
MLGQVARVIEESARQQGEAPSAAAPESAPALRQNSPLRETRDAEAPEGSFRREIEQRLEPMLERGPVRIEDVARALGCSRQTLYRRLKQEGVTFAELLDGLRRRLGLVYVRERGMSVKEAAYRLGFSEPAAFSRAYKRWTGSSPRRMNS